MKYLASALATIGIAWAMAYATTKSADKKLEETKLYLEAGYHPEYNAWNNSINWVKP